MEALAGLSLLVGLTLVDADGAVRERRQFLGQIVPPAPGMPAGVHVRAPHGEVVVLPADEAALLPAPRGRYRCLHSGETHTDPDLLTSWRVTVAEGESPRWEANYAPLVRSIVAEEWELDYRHDAEHVRRFVDQHAGRYLGRRVLVTLQIFQETGAGDRFLSEQNLAGQLARASFAEGAVLLLDSGKEFRLPPDLSLLQPAPPDAAQPRPDFVARWTVYRNPEDTDD